MPPANPQATATASTSSREMSSSGRFALREVPSAKGVFSYLSYLSNDERSLAPWSGLQSRSREIPLEVDNRLALVLRSSKLAADRIRSLESLLPATVAFDTVWEPRFGREDWTDFQQSRSRAIGDLSRLFALGGQLHLSTPSGLIGAGSMRKVLRLLREARVQGADADVSQFRTAPSRHR